jgi:hypothetical protein
MGRDGASRHGFFQHRVREECNGVDGEEEGTGTAKPNPPRDQGGAHRSSQDVGAGGGRVP